MKLQLTWTAVRGNIFWLNCDIWICCRIFIKFTASTLLEKPNLQLGHIVVTVRTVCNPIKLYLAEK